MAWEHVLDVQSEQAVHCLPYVIRNTNGLMAWETSNGQPCFVKWVRASLSEYNIASFRQRGLPLSKL